MKPLLWSLLAVACQPWINSPDACAGQRSPIILRLDATEAPRRFLRAAMVIPAQPGPLTLYYPKWIPGEHGPTGPITDLAGLKIRAAGKDIPWRRDDEDMYAFHCKVPDGAEAVEVALDFLSPGAAGGFSAGASLTPNLAVLSWNQTLLYPKRVPAREILVQASLRLPPDWKFDTALPSEVVADGWARFRPVTLDTLIDSPVLCGRYFKKVALRPKEQGPEHAIALAGESARSIDMSPELKANLDRLIDEGGALFGSRHYPSYTFLLALSDQIAHFGLEHHASSDNRVSEGMLKDDQMKKNTWASLLPHEYVHSWNGKYRRPKDMVTDDFQKPQRTRMLWVYEGLTQYLGVVLTARCGLWTPEQFNDNLALVAEWAKNQRGRSWRPLEDTAVAAQLLYYARGDWAAWRRSVDFYDEGVLLWLEVDVLIRETTHGKKSLDDFCRRFFGGPDGKIQLKPFTFDELVADLDATAPHNWKDLLTKRLTATTEEPPLEGLRRAGWKLGYGAKQSELHKETEGDAKSIDATATIGLALREDGTINDVVPGTKAHKAGVGPGMKIIAVNARRWSDKVFRAALAATATSGRIELLVENGDLFQSVTLEYKGGERFPRLERIEGQPDLLEAIVRPLVPPPGASSPK
ncbi:MAG: hypothetical protein L0Y72_21130 [Gemmataceae bacterium]|nr:hypothetical protein [Gemmataceae bacterium]MCI0741546.1 hypothetical protein [Gemmataceae bacterium]